MDLQTKNFFNVCAQFFSAQQVWVRAQLSQLEKDASLIREPTKEMIKEQLLKINTHGNHVQTWLSHEQHRPESILLYQLKTRLIKARRLVLKLEAAIEEAILQEVTVYNSEFYQFIMSANKKVTTLLNAEILSQAKPEPISFLRKEVPAPNILKHCQAVLKSCKPDCLPEKMWYPFLFSMLVLYLLDQAGYTFTGENTSGQPSHKPN